MSGKIKRKSCLGKSDTAEPKDKKKGNWSSQRKRGSVEEGTVDSVFQEKWPNISWWWENDISKVLKENNNFLYV